MKKKFAALVVVVGAWPLAATASADTGGTNLPFRANASGTVVSDAGTGTDSATIIGTHMGAGSLSAQFNVGGFPFLCPDTSVTVTTSTNLTAANGDVLFLQTTSGVCQPGSSSSFVATGTYTITGGTGRFANATGSGTVTSTLAFQGSPIDATGTFASIYTGTISLNRP